MHAHMPAVGYVVYTLIVGVMLFCLVRLYGKEFDTFLKASTWLSGLCLVAVLGMSALGFDTGAIIAAIFAFVFLPVEPSPWY